uniref:transcription termination factor Rho n=1 Tax=Enorma TaxID=1472762 RepID=UPI00037682C8
DAAAPLVDPALRPHRRGRKPKAFVEAEKAAAAAAAAQAAASGDAASAAPASTDAAPSDASSKAAPAGDAAPKAAPAEASSSSAAPATHEESHAKGEDAPRKREQGSNRRSHAQRREHTNGNNNGGNGNNGNDRRNRQQNRKNRNNRLAPAEPSLSRDDLSAMKVAELRERAKELDIDVAGMKKAELVEAVYTAAARAEGFRDIAGILDIANEGHGYIRAHGYMPSRDDAFVPANLIRAARLRPGDFIEGTLRPMRANDKFPGLTKIKSVNGVDPEVARTRPKFSDLTPIYPNEQLKMEHGKDSITGRAIDIVSPIGKGQRGLIVSPPKAGKTTILKKICQSIAVNNPEVHLICLLVDERPEEVTDMQRSIKGDVVASTFDMPADNHTRVSELVIERAKRIVEMGGDVVVVLDSITRLARAYNLAAPASGRILSGGVDSAALYPPKRFLGAARNIENGGSLTILASALVDTGSKMDEVIFEEFKGTGNMELKLDRDLADRRIFPAIDPVASGTRNEDLLIPEQMRPFVWGIRRVLAGMPNTERCAQAFIKGLKSTNTNEEFLIRSARRAQEHGEF